MVTPPVVLILEAAYAQHDHAKSLGQDAFRIVPVPANEVTIGHVLAIRPAIVAAELVASQAAYTLEFARLLRETPETRPTPLIIYGEHLHARDIENAARAGAYWVQLPPDNPTKLASAIRAILRLVLLMARPSLNHLDIGAAVNPLTVGATNASPLSSFSRS